MMDQNLFTQLPMLFSITLECDTLYVRAEHESPRGILESNSPSQMIIEMTGSPRQRDGYEEESGRYELTCDEPLPWGIISRSCSY
jgi:hypothetical protein